MAAVSSITPPLASIAGGRFELRERIAKGGFAEVWRGRDCATEELVAIKVEDYEDQALQLEDEVELLRALADPVQPEGFARVLHFGDEGKYCCLVTELLGASLADCLLQFGDSQGRFPAGLVALIAEQTLSRIAYLHSKGIVHRDIKPENFLCGVGSRAHHLYLIDFGLSRRYFENGKHIPIRTGISFRGTLRYVSINALKRVEQSRRDDLEALGYMLILLAQGSLPWSGQQANSEEEMHRLILEKKESVSIKELCAGLPGAFANYLQQVRSLGFAERPDYDSLRNLFHQPQCREGQSANDGFPWLAGHFNGVAIPLEPWCPPSQPDEGTRHHGRGHGAQDSNPLSALMGYFSGTKSGDASSSCSSSEEVSSSGDEGERHKRAPLPRRQKDRGLCC